MVSRAFDSINALRVEADHALQRTIYLTEELEALSSMIRIVKPFHRETAQFINEIREERRSEPLPVEEDLDETPPLLRDPVMTNLGVDFEGPGLAVQGCPGREGDRTGVSGS